ncbi:MAG TPA: thermonuclease family protein [Xanthobacteraceae bacterium]|jgi:endonuclease YncB( thermonuclease family)
MAGLRDPYSRTAGGHRSRHKPLFLVLVALVCLTGFYACSQRHLERRSLAQSDLAMRAPIVGRAWVVDGDTIHVAGNRIRLEGIDAPERDQSCNDADGRAWLCGQAATRQLRERIRGQSLTCRPRARDVYGRVVAACALPDGADVDAWLVRQGWAVATGELYAAEQAEARTEKRGIWAGSFMLPREWRRQKSNDPRRRFFGIWQ